MINSEIDYSLDLKQKHWIKKVLNKTATLLSLVLVAVVLTGVFGWMLGYKVIRINGWSMQPQIMYGNIIVVRKVFTPDELHVGDVVTFTRTGSGKSYVTHRIYSINGDKIVTKGDPNEMVDAGYITFENVVGKLVYNFNYLDDIIEYFSNVVHLVSLVLWIASLSQIINFYSSFNAKNWAREFGDNYKEI